MMLALSEDKENQARGHNEKGQRHHTDRGQYADGAIGTARLYWLDGWLRVPIGRCCEIVRHWIVYLSSFV